MTAKSSSVDPTPEEALDTPIDSVERLTAMTTEEVDELPYGFIILDAEGTILLYNRHEAALAHTAQERVVGRSFFHDVAPCTRVAAFFGRFREIAAAAPGTSRRFAFRFHFLHGAQDVLVQLTRAPDVDSAGTRVFLTVVRRKLVSRDVPHPSELTLDLGNGRLAGPLGPTLPLGARALRLALSSLGESAARDLGRDTGRDIAAIVKTALLQIEGKNVASPSPQLVAGAVDDTLARAGLGRLALDFTEYAAQSLIGALVRPPVEVPARPFSAFYEGLLAVSIGTLLDCPLTARCLDNLDLLPTPWLFTLGPPG